MAEPNSAFSILVKYFVDNFGYELLLRQRKPTNWREERAVYYNDRILELAGAFDKIDRYTIYFREFYPDPEKISEAEALEHHWHSYIQDFYILEERIRKIIGSLKNDLPRYNLANPEDGVRLLDHVKSQLIDGLEEAHKVRKEHSHERTARTFNLIKAKSIKLTIDEAERLGYDRNMLNAEYERALQADKEKLTTLADKNSEAMSKARTFFAPRFGHIFATLYGHDYTQFAKLIEEDK